MFSITLLDLPGGSVVKNPPANAGSTGDAGLIPGSGRSIGGGNSNKLPYSGLKKSHEQRSLDSYSPWGHKESDMAKNAHTELSTIS